MTNEQESPSLEEIAKQAVALNKEKEFLKVLTKGYSAGKSEYNNYRSTDSTRVKKTMEVPEPKREDILQKEETKPEQKEETKPEPIVVSINAATKEVVLNTDAVTGSSTKHISNTTPPPLVPRILYVATANDANVHAYGFSLGYLNEVIKHNPSGLFSSGAFTTTNGDNIGLLMEFERHTGLKYDSGVYEIIKKWGSRMAKKINKDRSGCYDRDDIGNFNRLIQQVELTYKNVIGKKVIDQNLVDFIDDKTKNPQGKSKKPNS